MAALLATLGCGSNAEAPKPQPQPPAQAKAPSKVIGRWMVSSDTAKNHSTLEFKADGTFREEYDMKGDTKQVGVGLYSTTPETVSGSKVEIIRLAVQTLDGKDAQGTAPVQLYFDVKGDSITDYKTIAYKRIK